MLSIDKWPWMAENLAHQIVFKIFLKCYDAKIISLLLLTTLWMSFLMGLPFVCVCVALSIDSYETWLIFFDFVLARLYAFALAYA